jgi:hypothetical protein
MSVAEKIREIQRTQELPFSPVFLFEEIPGRKRNNVRMTINKKCADETYQVMGFINFIHVLVDNRFPALVMEELLLPA